MANPAIVFDNGSAICKGGLSNEMEPSAIFPTIILRTRFKGNTEDFSNDDIFVATKLEHRINKNNILNYPIENGIVNNWEYMEKIWQYTFDDLLKTKPKELPMLLTEAPHNPNSNREKMAEIMYEKYSSPSILIMTQGVLSMFGAGQLSGIALEIGHGVTQAVPIMEGYTLSHSILRSDLAGSDLTDYLMKKLSNDWTSFTTRNDKEMIGEMKEKLCYVCEDYDKEMKKETNKQNHTLPDGRNIEIGYEKFQCPELLFDPLLMDINSNGVHKMLNECIQSCALDVRKSLYSNIVLAGGTAMLPGFGVRLKKELSTLISDGTTVKVKEVKNKYLAWIGGAVLANHSSFQKMSISKQQYEEYGLSILHKNYTK